VKALKHGLIFITVAALLVSLFPAGSASAAPGDVTYVNAFGTLGVEAPFRSFSTIVDTRVVFDGSLLVTDAFYKRLVRVSPDGTAYKILLDEYNQGGPFWESNTASPYILDTSYSSNNSLIVLTQNGFNFFDENDAYERLVPFAPLPAGKVNSNVRSFVVDPSTGELYLARAADANPDLDSPNPYGFFLEKYSSEGVLIDRSFQSTTLPVSNASFKTFVIDDAISVITPSNIYVYTKGLTQTRSQDVTDERQQRASSIERSANGSFVFTYNEFEGQRKVKTFTRLGNLESEITLSSSDSYNTTMYATYVDDAGNRYVQSGSMYSMDNITKYDNSGAVVYIIDQSPPTGVLSGPFGVVQDSQNNSYVLDSYQSRIQKFSAEGQPLLAFGEQGSGPGQLGSIYGIAIDDTDTVYVMDSGKSTVLKFTTDGSFISEHPVASADPNSAEPLGAIKISLDAEGNIYVLTGNSFLKYDSAFNFQYRKMIEVQAGNEYVTPSDIAVSRDGQVYVLDAYPGGVIKYDSDGTFLLSFGSRGSADGQLYNANGIAVDITGNVYVADGANYRVQKFSPTGEYLLQFGTRDEGPMQLNSPVDISINSQFDVFVVESNIDKVKRFEIEKNDSTIISADGQRLSNNARIAPLARFSGATEPFADVEVSISDASLSCATEANARGEWSCQLPAEVSAGRHMLTAAIALADESEVIVGPLAVQVGSVESVPLLAAPNTGVGTDIKNNSWALIVAVTVLIGLTITLIIRRVLMKQ
jgi:hypothetical protein